MNTKTFLKIGLCIFCLFYAFFITGCKNKNDNGLELLSFKIYDTSTTRKLSMVKTSNNQYDTYLEPNDNLISIEAVIKNNNRDSFIDMVLYISFLDTYVVYNEGNGEYTCSSTTVYENDLWVTKINLEIQLYKCKDLYGEISVSEINFLHNGSSNEQVDLNKTGDKNITFHRHLYNQEKMQDEFLAISANHYNKAKYYYSCECGAYGESTFEVGLPIKHIFDQQVTSIKYIKEYANCNHGDYYYYSCSCGHKGNEYFEVGENLEHSFAPYIYNEDETETTCGTVTRICTRCEYKHVEEVQGTGGTPLLVYEEIDANTCKVVDIMGPTTRTKIIVPQYYNGKQVIKIAEGVFLKMKNIVSVTIPFVGENADGSGATHFGYIFGASYYTENSIYVPTSLKEVIITGGTSIGYSAFEGCTSLESITIPFVGAKADGSGETHFGYIFGASSYYNNATNVPTSLKEVIITGGTSIGYRAFDGCTSLTSITIPESVTSIGYFAFDSCTSLESITIPESVTSIGNYAFRSCTSLTSITIPESVTSIGSGAFDSCTSLESITIPESVTSIGDIAFDDCTSLTSITIPEGVTSIGDYAFRSCEGLTNITIPESVTSIGYGAFRYCTSLTRIIIPFVGAKADGSGATHFGYIFGAPGSLYTGYVPTSLIEVIITDGTSIGSGAFYNCTSLESITIPESVTSIGAELFYNCTSLTSITIPESVTSIGYRAFLDCTSLTSITIPESVTSIGDSAFENCTSLKTVYNKSSLIFEKGSSRYGYIAYYATELYQ